MGTCYDRIAGIVAVFEVFNSGTAYGHISGNNSYDSNGTIRGNLMTGMGAKYDQNAEIGGILYRFNSDAAYGHIVVGYNYTVTCNTENEHGYKSCCSCHMHLHRQEF